MPKKPKQNASQPPESEKDKEMKETKEMKTKREEPRIDSKKPQEIRIRIERGNFVLDFK